MGEVSKLKSHWHHTHDPHYEWISPNSVLKVSMKFYSKSLFIFNSGLNVAALLRHCNNLNELIVSKMNDSKLDLILDAMPPQHTIT